jgi:uncharacterized repeat protein (TIGR03803 family)
VGTLFRYTTNRTFALLASFQGTNGSGPRGPLAFGGDGNLYGVTLSGGAFGLGTVFKASTNGGIMWVVSFNGTNGAMPNGGLVRGTNDMLYGTTVYGGSNVTGFNGKGTVFEITTNGDLTNLVYFNGTNGTAPYAGLSTASDGNLWGTTRFGGPGGSGTGTIFRMGADGAFTNIANFSGTVGVGPQARITQGKDGNFYGTTAYSYVGGGPALTNGTIFQVTPDGTITTLAVLNGTNGSHPFTDMTLASDGNLYGTMADLTGTYIANGGTIYRLVTPPALSATVTGTNVLLSWSSFSNASYRLEYVTSLTNSAWTTLNPNITATGNTTSLTDNPGSDPARYYRAVLLP